MKNRVVILLAIIFLAPIVGAFLSIPILNVQASTDEETKSPSETWPMSSPMKWLSPILAYSSGNNYTYASLGQERQGYKGYGFDLSGENIIKVEVGMEGYKDSGGVGLYVSWDGNATWDFVDAPLTDTDTLFWFDVTNETDWTPSKLSDDNFRTQIYYQGGTGCYPDNMYFVVTENASVLGKVGVDLLEIRDWEFYNSEQILDSLQQDKTLYMLTWNEDQGWFVGENSIAEQVDVHDGNWTLYDMYSGELNINYTVEGKNETIKWESHMELTSEHKIPYSLDGSNWILDTSKSLYDHWRNNETVYVNHLWWNYTLKPFLVTNVKVRNFTGKVYNVWTKWDIESEKGTPILYKKGKTLSPDKWNINFLEQETDWDDDGVPDILTDVTVINNTFLEFNITNTREKPLGYKWASAIANISGVDEISVWYEDAQGGFEKSYPEKLNYAFLEDEGLPSDWYNETGGYGFVLFSAGSGDKRFRLNFTAGEKIISIYSGSGSQKIRAIVGEKEFLYCLKEYNVPIGKFPPFLTVTAKVPWTGYVDWLPVRVTYGFIEYDVTFYYHNCGTILVDGENTFNGTVNSYNSSDTFNLTAVPSAGKAFLKHVYDSSEDYENPLIFTVDANYTFHTWFATYENFNPTVKTLIGSTTQTSGTFPDDIQTNNQVYKVFKSYVETQPYDAEDFVDDNTGDVDSSADKGTHSNFTAQQYYDGIYDTLTEVDTAGEDAENDIDNNTSDEDSSADKGTETDFSNAQGTSLDSNYMNIQEETSSSGAGSEWLSVDDFDNTINNWDSCTPDQEPWLDAIDGDVIQEQSTDAVQIAFFSFPATTLEGTITANISVYCKNDDGVDDDYAEVDVSWSGGGADVGNCAQHTTYSYDTFSIGELTVAQVNSIIVVFTYQKEGGGDDVYIDYARLGLSSSGQSNNQIDFEYQWTSSNYDSDNEKVCIYPYAHTGSETLNVNYRSDGSWTLLGTITTTGSWVNLTATGLVSATYTIQLIGATESEDETQDDWDIDLILMHTWNDSLYQMDLEVQWTSADYDEVNEQICINTGTQDAEALKVDVWNATLNDWENMIADLSASTWNNNSISDYLTSGSLVIRFKGATESSDTSQSVWQIECALIHTWSAGEYRAEIEFEGSSNDESWQNLNWTLDSAVTNASVSVTYQLYNYTAGAYVSSGLGYVGYTSSATPSTDELKWEQMNTTDCTDFRNGTYYWKLKVSTYKSSLSGNTTIQHEIKIDWIQFTPFWYCVPVSITNIIAVALVVAGVVSACAFFIIPVALTRRRRW